MIPFGNIFLMARGRLPFFLDSSLRFVYDPAEMGAFRIAITAGGSESFYAGI
jgi:hypothetical protein